MKRCNFIQNERGSTILENIIAFTILTGVIILLIGITMKIISKSNAERMWHATNLAQSEMEHVLFTKTYTDSLYLVERWKIDRSINFVGDKANINVKVYFKEERFPTVELNSVRICQKKTDLP